MPKEKTIHELVKEFPDKSYRELEKYRDADRQEEAQKIPLTESQQKQEELEPIAKGVCVTSALRKDREESNWFPDGVTFQEKYEKEHKLRQEAEGELTILKGIETNRVKEAQDALANALEVNESHQKLNGKLQERLTELEEELKRLHDAHNKKLDSARKAGL